MAMKTVNSSNYLDKSVTLFFLAAFLISASVLAYKYTSKVPCDVVVLDVKANKFNVGELVRFNDKTVGAESWRWDFGDDTSGSILQEALHVYRKPGEYNVRLLVNNSCEKVTTITINEKKKLIDSTKFPVFNIPKSILVGEQLLVEDETFNAKSWEWRFGETAGSNSSKQKASYVYTTPGLKTISLVVNDDLNYITKKQIEVIPLPEKKEKIEPLVIKEAPNEPAWKIKDAPKKTEAKEEEPAPAPYISDAQFAQRLMMVSRGEATAKSFSDFFCGDLGKQIVAEGKTMSFLVFCERIQDRKIKKIKRLQVFRDENSNCIKTITIDYSKKGLF